MFVESLIPRLMPMKKPTILWGIYMLLLLFVLFLLLLMLIIRLKTPKLY